MEERLNFLETQTTEQFKATQGVEKIYIKQNPKNNNIFMAYGTKTGMVSAKVVEKLTKGQPVGTIMFSHVTGKSRTTGEPIDCWLLHEEGQGGAPVLASF